jgi:hypothetical protein
VRRARARGGPQPSAERTLERGGDPSSGAGPLEGKGCLSNGAEPARGGAHPRARRSLLEGSSRWAVSVGRRDPGVGRVLHG